MAEVGTYYITIMPEMSQFTGEVNSALKGTGASSGKSYSTSFIDVVKGSALGSALGSLANKAGGYIASGISTGINRLDTLENFPRVMESFGYSSEEASAAVNNIMEHLRGLPTASQDVVSLTQAISDSTNDINLASRAALGFNDMLLAAGATTQDTATATGVLNRILGKGSATTAQWQSLMAVMPKQLDLVAESMLGAGSSSMDLYQALEDGTVSYGDFLAAIVKLDEEGSGATKSFYEQAKANSIGIGSAISNIGNRIGAGWANVFKALGQKEIHDTLEGIADALKAPLDALANAIDYFKKKIGNTKIAQNLKKIFDGVSEALGKIDTSVIKDVADKLIELVDGALQWIVDHGELVSTLLVGIGSGLAAVATFFSVIDLATKLGLLAGTPGIIQAVWAALSANPFAIIVGLIAAVASGLYYFFTQTETGKAIWESFCNGLKELWEGLKTDWKNLCDVFSREWESFQAFIDGIPEWWQGVMDYWSSAMDEQKRNFALAWDKIKSDFSDAWEAIKKKASDVWNGICTTVTTTVNNIKTTLANIWENIKTTVNEKWTAIKNFISTTIENIRTSVSNKVSEIKTNVSTTVDNIRTAISEKLTSAKEKALSIFDNIKNGIKEKIDWAYEKVKGIVDDIKGLFDFDWSLPEPKLPHVTWDWTDVGGIVSIPSFGVEWYGKGGVFDSASVIGIGERGKEAALPLNRTTYGEIARGIAREGGAGVTVTGNTFIVREDADIDRIADALNRKIYRERLAML